MFLCIPKVKGLTKAYHEIACMTSSLKNIMYIISENSQGIT